MHVYKNISHTRVPHHSGMVKHAQFDELSYYRVRFGGPCCNCAATRRGGWMCVPTSKQAVSPRDKVGAAVGGLHRHDPTLSIVAQAQFQNRGGRAHGGVSLTNEVWRPKRQWVRASTGLAFPCTGMHRAVQLKSRCGGTSCTAVHQGPALCTLNTISRL